MKLLGPAVRAALLLLGTTLLLFPNVARFSRHLAHLADPESLIEPDHPAVAALSREIDRGIPPGFSRPDQVRWIETFVEKCLPYAHDWTQWWNVDYWPTVSEALEAGREDCDGIAVVTASILRHRGFRARLVGNTLHIWVAVDDTGQEILGAQEDKAFASDTGWTLPRLDTLLRGARFGLLEFPAARWAMVVTWVFGIVAWGSRRRVVESVVVGLLALGLALAAARLLDGAPFAIALAALLAALAAAQIAIRRRRRAASSPSIPNAPDV